MAADRIIADASVFLSVALNEPAKARVIQRTQGLSLVAPEILHYEIANALSALYKRGANKIAKEDILTALREAQRIPVQLVPVEIDAALKIAVQYDLYAYDAYYLQCARETGCPLMTFDGRMQDVAKLLKIAVKE